MAPKMVVWIKLKLEKQQGHFPFMTFVISDESVQISLNELAESQKMTTRGFN